MTDKRHVYFLTDGEAIKIGHSLSARGRIIGLQGGNPRQLTLIGYYISDAEEEGRLHRKFVHLRIRREWFRPGADLMAHIERLGRIGRLLEYSAPTIKVSDDAPAPAAPPKAAPPQPAVARRKYHKIVRGKYPELEEQATALRQMWRKEKDMPTRERLRQLHASVMAIITGRNDTPQMRELLAKNLYNFERFRELGLERYLAWRCPGSYRSGLFRPFLPQ